MEEEDGVPHNRGSAMGNDTLALNYSQKAGVDAGSVDLVGRLKTLSSGRKKLMTKYFDLEEVESGPLLSEYFAVSLAFVALGAMIREANVRMRRKDIDNTDGVSPKLQRMALDSMLKSAMERLRGLAHRTQSLEEKVRDRSYMEAAFQFERLEFLKRISGLEATITKHEVTIAKYEATIAKHEASIAKSVEAEAVWRREKEDLAKHIGDVDAQRGYFFKKMAEAEGSLADMQRLRMEDGKANAKLVEIYAGREQSWKSERIKLRHEIELLKEKLSRLQPQSQMKSPRSFDAAAEALRMRNLKRRAKEMVREKVVSEREFAALVAVEQNSKSEVDSRSPKESSVPADERKDSEGDMHELSAAQNQEMEAELAIILKRVGALKRRGASGGKLDELLNEAKGKPKLKRLGSLDQAPKGMIVDDTFLPLSEANNMKDVEIDKEDAKDIWQAIEVQEGKSVQRRNGFVDEVASEREPVRIGFIGSSSPNTLESNTSQRPPEGLTVADCDRAPLRMSVLDSTEFIQEKPKPNTPEKSSSPRTPDWLTVVENDRDLESDTVNRNFASEPTMFLEESLNPDDGGWEEFLKEKPSSPGNNIIERESWEELIEEKPNTPESSNSERDGWEEFIQEKLDTLENNISERTPEGLAVADHDRTPESVAVNNKLTSDQTAETLNLNEGGWEESVDYENGQEQDFKGYSITCVQPGSPEKLPVVSPVHDPVDHGLDGLILFEDDIKSEILVGSDQLEEAHSQLSSGSQGQTEASAQEIDQMSAELGNPGEIPGASPAHDPVEHSVVDSLEPPGDVVEKEIDTSNPVSTSFTLDSGHVDSNDHKDELSRADTIEGETDGVSDNDLSSSVPSDGLNLEIAQDDLNNSTQQLSPGQTSPQLSPGRTSPQLSPGVKSPQLSPGRTIIAGLELGHQESNGGD
ncbi:hypothetical protein M758_10G109000 [Ceratodon purpureus]|nr:hypothetical protein M758_10G109000 [Ceratodon purpureus]